MEIKFRGIGIKSKEYVYGAYIKTVYKNGTFNERILTHRLVDGLDFPLCDYYGLVPGSAEIFTGRVDEEGKDLYKKISELSEI